MAAQQPTEDVVPATTGKGVWRELRGNPYILGLSTVCYSVSPSSNMY